MRRSRRNGQFRRVSSSNRRSISRDQDLFLVVRRLRNHAPERIGEKRPAPELQTRPLHAIAAHVAVLHPTRFTAATYTPFAIACARWIVCHASYCAAPYSSFSAGCQPIAVG